MKPETNRKIGEILESLDNCKRATAPDFFYTRLKARMEQNTGTYITKKPFVLRPAFVFPVLAAILVINFFVIFQRNNTLNSDASVFNEAETFQTIAADYSLNDNNTILFDLNQDR